MSFQPLWRLLTFLAVISLARPAAAQIGSSGISGTAKDSSGAVLPGVTVEASSPSLIEGSRTTVTDSAGQYRITDLRPGDYVVTFTLTGFRTVRREGIMLPAAFVATVNADMSVGTLEEAITVTGESPLVDVRSTATGAVMNREKLDAIPTGKDPFAVGQLIPGVTTTTPDVGGTQVMQQPTLQVHGSSNNDNVFMVDGVQIQHIGFGGNQTGFYYNDGLMEEISYTTSSLPAEAPVGGVQINMIPKEGGNAFHGMFFATGANTAMQSNNLSQENYNLGFKAQNKVQSVYDFNGNLGGPIVKDRAWFFATVRRWSSNNYLGNTFTSTGAQAIDDQHLTDITGRTTFQINHNNKVTVHYDQGIKWRGHRPNNYISVTTNDPLSDVVQTTDNISIGEVKWTAPLTNHLVAEAAVFTLPVYYRLLREPGTAPDAIATLDQTNSAIYNITPREDVDSARMYTYAGNVSYVSGAHEIKVGTQVRTGWSQEQFTTPGDIIQVVVGGKANSVRLTNTPSGHLERGVNSALYAQDSWRFDRVTINYGLRYEHFLMSIPAQSSPAGTWVPARSFAAQDGIVDWNTFSPRLGASWDLNGDGRTAVKGGVSRYDRLEGVTIVQPLNQRNISFETCPWTDNGDLVAQMSEIDFSKCTGAFTPTLGYVDPNLVRPHQWEYTAMVQRQIGSKTSVSVGYYGRQFSGLYTTVNALAPSSAYTPATITNPLTGVPMTVYNLNTALKNSVQNTVTTIPALSQRYDGVEFQANTRTTNLNVFGGITIGKDRGDLDSGDLNNPNVVINNNGAIGFDARYQLRGGFSYRFPYQIQFSGSVREAQGLPRTITYTVTTTDVPGLTQVTQSVKLAPAGDYRYPWVNIVDLRFSKVFRAGNTRIEPIADLFNVFNNDATTSATNTFGPSLGRPSAIVMGRLLRLGGRITF
ncbi:MAG TPA: TonB-dependent receptor [Vicinamibacterales bacterium]